MRQATKITRVPVSSATRPLAVACILTGVAVLIIGSRGTAAAPAADPAVTGPAQAAVVAFLDAVKRGDDEGARGMLTQVARAKTKEMGISVAPPVNDTATYSVRACEIVGEAGDVVHVATTWTDVDSDGFKSTDNVIWVTRLDPEGWRVVGMAMKVFEDLPPLLLDFEDPADMIAKQELVAAELRKRATQGNTPGKPAGQPGTPPGNQGPTRTARGPAPQPGSR
jgi:hypothetical protein